jgi:putative nucleotidyltransferase with HDIG domain
MALLSYPLRFVLPASRAILAVRGITQKFRQIQLTFRSSRRFNAGHLPVEEPPIGFQLGLRFRLVALVLFLVATTTLSVSIIVMQIMDQNLMDSLIKRGGAITQAAAVPAGYSLLTDDRLALDNLAAQIKRTQAEIVYVAILDLEQTILAHSHLDRVNDKLPLMTGPLLGQPADISIIRGLREGMECFEFRRAIFFADRHVGDVVIGIGIGELMASKALVHRQILLVAGVATGLALLGALLISSIFTRPIERLTEGVSRLQKNEPVYEIPVQSRNELGILTRNFNRMARMIQQQNVSLREYAAELGSSYYDMVRILSAALDARDNYTYGHSARVARLALGLADRLNFSPSEIQELELACLLHDIGKIHVPDAILNKDDRLDQKEHAQILKHPLRGSQILELVPSLHKFIPVVKHHHERYDGSGYPGQLSGDAIPLHAQIVALADTYDAMTSSRPYRQGLNREVAIAEIRRCSGSQFNPQLVEPFVEVVQSLPEELLDDILRAEYLCAS